MSDALTLLRFELGGIACALSLLEARRVLRADAIQPRPAWPADVAGCVWHEGEAIPVLDLRATREADVNADARVIVLAAAPRVAVLVDRVPGTVRVDATSVAPPASAPGLPDGAVAGVVMLAAGPAWLVRADRLLTAAQRAAATAARGSG